MSTQSEGRNLEEINKKKILNFGDLSRIQKGLGVSVNWDEAWVKCQRCNKREKVKWKDHAWNTEANWRTYMWKSQVEKGKMGYYITARIEFYCGQCDSWHNWRER